MLGMVTGDLGRGKTILLTYFAEQYPDVPVYSNYKLNMPNYIPTDIYSVSSITHGILLLDEAYEWLESRLSGSDANLYISRIIFNSRKRGMDLFCSAQLGSTLDMRFRDLAQLRIIAVGMARDMSGYFYIINEKSLRLLTIKKAEQLYGLFNTYEEQEPLHKTLFDANKINPEIDKLAKDILKKCDKNKVKITKGLVRDIFLSNKYDLNLQELTYYRIQSMKALA